ncbi:MAG: hypothetical protein JWO60_479 [Frankiales bacterium]|nr:hypothetical protein [Frankiales bacterium]
MTDTLALRRHLYEQLRTTRRPRRRSTLRRQIALLAEHPAGPGDDGSSGVREPRRPLPPSSSPGQSTSAL